MTCNCKNLSVPCYECLYGEITAMTQETLSAEDFETFKQYALEETDTLENEILVKALNTIEARDKEIEALKGQVAVLRNWFMGDIEDKCFVHVAENYNLIGSDVIQTKADEILPKFMPEVLRNTQATAEAFIAKERADEREKSIRECLNVFDHFKYYTRAENVQKAIEALLTKEQA